MGSVTPQEKASKLISHKIQMNLSFHGKAFSISPKNIHQKKIK